MLLPINAYWKIIFASLALIAIVLVLFRFYFLPFYERNKAEKERVEEVRLNHLISCIEKEYKSVLREFYELCGVNNEKDCLFANTLLNASFEHKYNLKKDECLVSYYRSSQ